MKHNLRSPSTGRFIAKKQKNKNFTVQTTPISGQTIVGGRLYNYKGTIVRAFGKVNGKRFVSCHKTLTGLVDDSELSRASKEQVEKYLAAIN